MFGGGGKQSNTLAETPQNLKDMVKDNYKKMAILKLVERITFYPEDLPQTQEIILPEINFTPSQVYIHYYVQSPDIKYDIAHGLCELDKEYYFTPLDDYGNNGPDIYYKFSLEGNKLIWTARASGKKPNMINFTDLREIFLIE